MGSNSFTTTYIFNNDPLNGRGAVSAADAYRTLVDDALSERGHNGHNGTISTTDGFRVVQSTPVSYEDAVRISNERCDDLNKWGVCEAVPFLKSVPEKRDPQTQHTVNVTIPADKIKDHDWLVKTVARQLSVRPQDVTSAIPHTSTAAVDKKVEVAATTGATETRYFLIIDGATQLKWENGHPSQAAARAAIGDVRSLRIANGESVQVEVVSMTRRVTGEPLVKATVSARRVTVDVYVTVAKLITAQKTLPEQGGWLFYGWAAS